MLLAYLTFKKRKIILWNKNNFKWNVWWKSFQLSLTLLSSSVSQCMASAHKTVSEHLQWWACAVVYHQANFSLQWRGNVTYCASLFFSSSYLLTFHFMICILLLQNIVLTELRYPKFKRNIRGYINPFNDIAVVELHFLRGSHKTVCLPTQVDQR